MNDPRVEVGPDGRAVFVWPVRIEFWAQVKTLGPEAGHEVRVPEGL